VNLGIQGDTTQTILWRLDHGALDGASPKVIILMIGVNNKPSPENYKAIAQGIRLCLENLRKRCPDSNIILVKTLPAGWVLNENIHRLNDTVGEMKLDRDPKIQLLDIWDDLTNPDGTVESNIYMDGFLHVGAEGYEIWAAKLEPLINKTLNMEKSKGPYTGVEAIRGDAHPDILTVPADLELPVIGTGEPAPGKVVLQSLPAYAGTAVAHTLYLPTDWTPDKKFPVIVEYLGNTARVRDFRGIGYGLSAGRGFIWAVLPFVNPDRKSDAAWWWGDVELTVSYAKEAVPAICKKWGGNPSQVILVGSSRGAIACNYIGLHDDEIAKLWRGMIAFSHYNDAHISWGMTPEEQKRAPERLQRLGKIPQLICGEHCSIPQQGSDAKLLDALKEKNLSTFEAAKKELGLVPITEVEGTRKFISENYPQGNYTIMDLSWVNHGSNVLLRDTPERQRIRDWIRNVLQGGSYGCDEGK
ncbi:MAG: GDSL-type esterase/lipase family protein, partial [Lentisphaerota bacterium]